MKNNISAILFALAIVIASVVLGNAYINRNKSEGTISVTGLGKTDFTSDLIVWSGRFSKQSMDLKTAYAELNADKEIVRAYLSAKGIADSVMVFGAVRTMENSKRVYADNGKYIGDEFLGYTLKQNVIINSKEVEKVQKISREVTELLNQGVQFYSDSPRYYYTKLADLKIEMISRATENACLRAEMIAQNSGSSLGELRTAKMGIFQITGQNSNEDYSWGGAFNTSSKEKTASITMKLVYQIE